MIDVEFSDIQQLEMTVSDVSERLSDYSGFWNDFAVGLLATRLGEVFETEGYGTWVALNPLYAREKAESGFGSRILQRSGTYFSAATVVDHPGNVFVATPTELMYGVDASYFISRFGENYPERHEMGIGVAARRVFGLLAENPVFESEVEGLLDEWSRDEIAASEAEFGA